MRGRGQWPFFRWTNGNIWDLRGVVVEPGLFKIRVFVDNLELGFHSKTPGFLIIVFFSR